MQTPLKNRCTIALPELKKDGFFQGNQTGRLAWSNGFYTIMEIRLWLDLDQDEPEEGGTLHLRWSTTGGVVDQDVAMLWRPSNLGIEGGIWYFVCPQTGRFCRHLYWHEDRFVSRHGGGGLRYWGQLASKRQRARENRW